MASQRSLLDPPAVADEIGIGQLDGADQGRGDRLDLAVALVPQAGRLGGVARHPDHAAQGGVPQPQRDLDAVQDALAAVEIEQLVVGHDDAQRQGLAVGAIEPLGTVDTEQIPVADTD